ncbi:hypothetical protein Sjap_001581 [Stephania japonica]|uniref:Uncharacterized protein n=1 Tax=Stephania japonica TaxID=461633 RepID=A0AAP0KK84_9MAGN
MAHEPSLCSSPSSNLIVLMDVLWFQQLILISSSQSMNKITSSSTSNPLLNLKTTAQTPSISSTSHSSHLDDDIEVEALDVLSSSDSSPLLPQEIEEEDDEAIIKYKRKRPTRLSLVIASKTRSHSSSPSIHKLPKHMRQQVEDYIDINSTKGLRRTRSLKSLEELEFEEVKGFMDLGFTFKGDQLNHRMMSVIPGLQRLVGSSVTSIDDDQPIMDDQDDQKSIISGSNKSGNITRPYLSEAWLIKRPDSPLLNLRIPRIKGTSSDVKKQIRSWARNVASVIQFSQY